MPCRPNMQAAARTTPIWSASRCCPRWPSRGWSMRWTCFASALPSRGQSPSRSSWPRSNWAFPSNCTPGSCRTWAGPPWRRATARCHATTRSTRLPTPFPPFKPPGPPVARHHGRKRRGGHGGRPLPGRRVHAGRAPAPADRGPARSRRADGRGHRPQPRQFAGAEPAADGPYGLHPVSPEPVRGAGRHHHPCGTRAGPARLARPDRRRPAGQLRAVAPARSRRTGLLARAQARLHHRAPGPRGPRRAGPARQAGNAGAARWRLSRPRSAACLRHRPCCPAAGRATCSCSGMRPGLPNLHSHAFQRAFAGLAEYRAERQDSFWSWRQLMYRFAAHITPGQMQAMATWLYVEMLEAGYTRVCEFHYLHHDHTGQPYADDARMSLALLHAARTAGIGITLLPALYQSSGFGAQPPHAQQARFIRSTASMLSLLKRLRPIAQAQGAVLGLALHSLRAVPPDSLQAAVQGITALDPQAPIHIHIAEQQQEVDDCIAWSGQRPVQWLLDHAPVDARWCLVHATRMTPDEHAAAARTGAVVGLCPSTEANLGDGIFDLPLWLQHGGRWGLGSDSHICVNAAEELLLLEYGQRLSRRQRNVLAHATQPEVATAMSLQAVQGGAQAAGHGIGAGLAGIAVGRQADLVVLDAQHLALRGLPAHSMLSAHVFGSQRSSALDSLWVAGVRRVAQGRHALHEAAAQGFIAARSAIIAAQRAGAIR